MKNIWDDMITWRGAGTSFVLARVVKTWRSAPRPVGAAMIVDTDLNIAGSVSGGCVEAAVVEVAGTVLGDGQPRMRTFGVDDGWAWSVGLTCGGEMTVRVEVHPAFTDPELWDAMVADTLDERTLVWVTSLGDGAAQGHLLLRCDDSVVGALRSGTEEAIAAARLARQCGESGVAELSQGPPVFCHVVAPPDRLLIIGAGDIAVHLVAFARRIGLHTTVVDPRAVFAAESRFVPPPDRLICGWPHEVIDDAELNAHTYAVLLTHDPKIDDPMLQRLLRSPTPYIGALGSRKTQAGRCRRLQEAGFDEERCARIRGPVGLNIGARTSAEIAVSILGEVIESRRQV